MRFSLGRKVFAANFAMSPAVSRVFLVTKLLLPNLIGNWTP